ncbi:Uncharacterized protein APZ42_008564 [Daphnia magna]|uniref:Uncharacterized protein n=1 Tax=Daphnia magna TaxID=35525 RepID=A0A162D085_9CRUS|nr:Uncharacterized protein APZ42_008564 [Daphnia magna]
MRIYQYAVLNQAVVAASSKNCLFLIPFLDQILKNSRRLERKYFWYHLTPTSIMFPQSRRPLNVMFSKNWLTQWLWPCIKQVAVRVQMAVISTSTKKRSSLF